MSTKSIMNVLQKYRSSGRRSRLRQSYLRDFVPKMLYRTTKTEHPETTKAMVSRVLKSR